MTTYQWFLISFKAAVFLHIWSFLMTTLIFWISYNYENVILSYLIKTGSIIQARLPCKIQTRISFKKKKIKKKKSNVVKLNQRVPIHYQVQQTLALVLILFFLCWPRSFRSHSLLSTAKVIRSMFDIRSHNMGAMEFQNGERLLFF